MIAQLAIALPFHLAVPEKTSFNVYEWEQDGYRIKFLPPERSDRPTPNPGLKAAIDGATCYFGDILRIDFAKNEFDRRHGAPLDPPVELIRELVAWFCARARYVLDAPLLQSVDFPMVPWRIRYLNNDGTELESKPGFSRGRGSLSFQMSCMALSPAVWDGIFALPAEFTPPEWEVLLLDARAAMPAIGQAVALTATALEVFIATLMDRLAAKATVSKTLWEWINDRGFFLKEPSTEERFDVLLKEFCGVTLKDNADLWAAFKNLRQARNNFIHGGVPVIGGKVLSRDDATKLIDKAYDIVSFVKDHLPPDLKWPKPQFNIEVQLTQEIPVEKSAEQPAEGKKE